jgi:ABC-type multidrug transport system permease subunit
MKIIFNWLLKYHKAMDISSLLVFILALFFINLFDYKHIRNNPFLLIPFLIIVILAMRIFEGIFRAILKKRNIKISKSYFYLAIFLVITVTSVIKFFN